MEDSFPRGGPKGSASKRKADKQSVDVDLFKIPEEGLSASKKKKLLKQTRAEERDNKKRRQKDAAILQTDVTAPRRLLRKHLSPGMLILGSVKQIYDLELSVALPNGVTGVVSITDVCDAYTDILREITSDEADEAGQENVSCLSDLFYPGQVIRAKVKDIPTTEVMTEGKKKPRAPQVKLSVNPREVNSQLSGPLLKHGMVLVGAVASQEDHGYVLDLGIQGTSCFVKNAEVNKYTKEYNGDTPLRVGQLLHCTLTDDLGPGGGGAMARVSLDPPRVHKASVKEHMGLTVHTLVPGMVVDAKVSKIQDEGVNVKFLSFTGNIHKSHLHKSSKDFNTQDKIRAALLHIDPTLKTMTLTQLPHLVTPVTSDRLPFGEVKIGDTIEKAKVVRVDGGHGVILTLDKSVRGLALRNQLSDKEISNPNDVFKKGQLHRCRVLSFDYMDHVAMVTLRESILNEPYLRIADITPGQLIETQITAFTPAGVRTKLTSHIHGYIQNLHLSDITLRKPEKKFSVGDKLKCRVLAVHRTMSLVYLTHKRSLVTSPHPAVTSYTDDAALTPGTVTDGYVFRIQSSGLVVRFYGDVQGFVPKSEMSTAFIDLPDKVFYPGQVVRCVLIRAEPSNRRLIYSLKISGRKDFGEKTMKVPDDFKVGKLVDCKISEKTDSGLNVTLLPSNMAAYIPTPHLSDHHDNCDMLYSVYKKGDVISNAMYLGKQNAILLTKKQSLIKAFSDDKHVKTFDDLVPGMLLPGVIKKKADYGVFVDLGHSLIGLAPNKYISDKKSTGLSFDIGQSVVAKVTEVDKEKSRFLLSLRMSDCYHGDLDSGLDLVAQYCEEYKVAMETLSKRKGAKARLASYTIGQVVQATVTMVTEEGVHCELSQARINGLISLDHLTGVACAPGDELSAAVLHVDATNLRLDLSADAKLLKHITSFSDDKCSQVAESQTLKSDVLLVKDSHVLVCLRGHTLGRLAYLPAKRHLNEAVDQHHYTVGKENHVVIKRLQQPHPLCVLKVYDAEYRKLHPETDESDIEVGSLVKVQIQKVLANQLNVQLGPLYGRVHITEVTDKPKKGKSPLEGFSKHEEIEVKVIGFREVTKNGSRYVSRDEGHGSRLLVECSLRPSIKQHKELKIKDLPQSASYKNGDRVRCYINRVSPTCVYVSVNPMWNGRIDSVDVKDGVELSVFTAGDHIQATVMSVHTEEHTLDLTLHDTTPKIQPGSVTTARVTLVSRSHGVTLELSQGHAGVVAPTDLCDALRDDMWTDLAVHARVSCYVISAEKGKPRQCQLSLRASRVQKGTPKVIPDPEVSHKDKLKVGRVLRGVVTTVQAKGLTVCIGRGVSGHVDNKHMSVYYINSLQAAFPVGKVVTAKIIRLKASSVELSLLASHTGVPEVVPADQRGPLRTARELEAAKRKATGGTTAAGKVAKRAKTGGDSDEDSGVDSDLDLQPQTAAPPSSAPRLSLSVPGFSWSTAPTSGKQAAQRRGSDVSDTSDSDDDEATALPVRKPRKTKQEKIAEDKLEELKLVEREQTLLSGEATPQTTDDFDRLVVQSPDSSLVWLGYMAHCLESAEIERARGVAERALKTISFREEQERMNVWVAYLNLENLYGSEDDLKKTFSRAKQNNDAVKITTQLVQIYARSDKMAAAASLYDDLLKRHRGNKDVWLGYGGFLFKNAQYDKARELMQRALKSLEKKEHVEVIAKFAQLEFREGEAERGKTMFENVLSSYPKRTDLWSVYIDMVTKLGELQPVRQLYERVINLNLTTKKMRFFFKKYLAFEERHGDEETVQAVKVKAMEYVEAKAEQS